MIRGPFRRPSPVCAAVAALICFSQAGVAQTPLIGNIRYFAFNFAPVGWEHCDGQLLQVVGNEPLFSLIGTTYGGDGRITFGLPDMRGRLPVHQGQGAGLSLRQLGQNGGTETVVLTDSQIGHDHTLRAYSGAPNQSVPTAHALAADDSDTTYRNEAPSVTMQAGSVTSTTGGGGSHENRPPFLGVYCNIALVGIFPSRN